MSSYALIPEDEPNEGPQEDDSDDEPINPLVDALFDEVEDLRIQVRGTQVHPNIHIVNFVQLFESEMRCAIIEAETREEVMREMEARMRTMEEMYSRRLMNEVSSRCNASTTKSLMACSSNKMS